MLQLALELFICIFDFRYDITFLLALQPSQVSQSPTCLLTMASKIDEKHS